MKKRQTIRLSGVVLVWLVIGAFGMAWGEETEDRTLSPYFFVENGSPESDPLPLKETQVAVAINGVIADVRVTQVYSNQGTRPINARYIFPGSTRAAVHGLRMTIGEQVIEAKIKERQQAQRAFNAAKKAGKSASLLKQNRPNVFSMNVANIMPQDTIQLELRYTELLTPTDKVYEFVYPTVVGPRYSSQKEATAPETDRWVKNPYLSQGTPNPTRFDITASLSTGIPLQELACDTHDTRIEYQGDAQAQVSLRPGPEDAGNRDFILRYRLAGEEVQTGLLLYEGSEENFFLLMAEPPQRVLPEQIPGREYLFVVDISGSMNGFPLNTAKKLLTNLIGGLRLEDRFNVILFAGGSQVMATQSLPATQGNIRKAIHTIEQQRGGGGTELRSALEKAYRLPRMEAISRTVVVITDGYINAEGAVFDLIRENLNETNVFAFGIGSSVNRYLIEGIAKAGNGEPFVVTRPNTAPAIANTFMQYIKTPVLTNISIDYDDFEVYDVEPLAFGDLFAQRPLIVFGKWRGNRQGALEVSGQSGQGLYQARFDLSQVDPRPGHHALPYLWARKRIARLSDAAGRQMSADQKQAVTSLGLTYNLLTRFTSFIAIHDVVRHTDPNSPARDVTQPLPLPKHVSNLAVGGSVAKVPEPELYILAGMLVLAGLIGALLRRKAGAC